MSNAVTTENFQMVLSREYWITQKGEKLFAHDFTDEHLSNTLGFLHRLTKKYRLEDALSLCDTIHRIGYDGRDNEHYYRHHKKQVDAFLDPDLSDEKWLKQNSKIYTLLLEEAKFRGVKINMQQPKSLFKSTLKSSYNMSKQFIYNW